VPWRNLIHTVFSEEAKKSRPKTLCLGSCLPNIAHAGTILGGLTVYQEASFMTADGRRLSIGARLRELREASGFSQAKLAKAIHKSVEQVAQWERDERVVPLQAMEMICSALDIHLAAFANCDTAGARFRLNRRN
jgi:DNA-binding XRE family transcriptional regulator